MLRLLLAAALAVAVAPLQAQTTDQLWNSVLAQLNGAQRWAAAEMELVNDVNSGGTAKRGSATLRLSGWKDGKPVYDVVKTDPPDKKMPKDVSFLQGLASLADAFTGERVPHRSDGQVLDGAACTVFETSADKSGGVKLWVDPVSGAPRKMAIAVHLPLMVDGTVTTRYAAGPQGYAMPAQTDYAFDILIPFKKAKVHMVQTVTSWVAKPGAAAAKE